MQLLEAVVLGIVEGLTEFLPVSSTGHLILVGYMLGFESEGRVFEIVIQLGAIFAICVLFAARLWHVLVDLPSKPEARRFVLSVLVAFIPAMVLGVLFHPIIKGVLFSPWVVVTSLVLGGIAILLIERLKPTVIHSSSMNLPPGLAFKIGLCQALAMVPGVSRSGATILGAVLLGVDRRAAAEFSFFLAIPTMLAATVYDLFKNRDTLVADDLLVIALGFVTAFIVALVVVRALLAFLSRHTFEIFGWYRIVIGSVMAIVLLTQT